jgi:hypothetical protein
MLDCQERGDPRSHRITHHIGALDSQMIEQPACVLGHGRRLVARRIIKLLAFPMPPVVERDDPPPGVSQRPEPVRIAPVDDGVGGEPVDEKDRFS